MAVLKKGGAVTTGRKFEYKSRTAEGLRKRAAQSGGSRNWYLKDEIPGFTPAPGGNRVRYLPSFEEDAEHWGLDVWVHFNVGVDNSAHICFDEINKKVPLLAALLPKGVKCPGCIERKRAQQEGEVELDEKLAPKKRVIALVVDRNHESEGPKLWSQPFTIDREVCGLSIDKASQEVYELDNPYEGYDVSFERIGTDQKTKYQTFAVARKATPLSDKEGKIDEWLQFAQDHPLTQCVIIPDPAEFEAELTGGVVAAKATAKPSEAPAKQPEVAAEPEGDVTEAEVTWEFVQKADRDFLEEKALELEFDAESVSNAEDSDLREAICDSLGLTPPAKATSMKDRLKEMRNKK